MKDGDGQPFVKAAPRRPFVGYRKSCAVQLELTLVNCTHTGQNYEENYAKSEMFHLLISANQICI